jgi:hypothetical protein
MSIQVVDRIAGDPLNVAFVANAAPVQKLDKGYQCIAYGDVRITGTLTLAGYTAPPTKFIESIENILATLNISATGKGGAAAIGTIKACDAAYFYRMTHFLEGAAPPRTDVGTNNSAYTFETNFRVYFSLPPRGRRIGNLTPRELYSTHVLDARFMSNFTATYQFRDQTAMVTGGTGGTATLSGVQATFQVREITGFPSHDQKGQPILRPYVKEEQFLFDVTQTQLAKRYKDLPTGNRYRRVTFKGTVGATPYADPSDQPFNFTGSGRAEGPHLVLQENNAFAFMDIIYQQQRATNKNVFGIETMPTGYVVWEPASGRNTRGVERMDLLADVNFTGGQTNEIQATLQQIVA